MQNPLNPTQTPYPPVPSCKVSLSSRSNTIFVLKFIREFSSKLPPIVKTPSPISLHFLEMQEIMISLSFLPPEGPSSIPLKNSRDIVKEIWKFLRGNHKSRVFTRNLLVFLLAVLNLKTDKETVPIVEDDNALNDGGEDEGNNGTPFY